MPVAEPVEAARVINDRQPFFSNSLFISELIIAY